MALQETAPVQTKSARLRMTYDEYRAWVDEDAHTEWVDGEVVVFMPPKTYHQAVLHFVAALLGQYVQLLDLGRVLIAPFEVKLRSGRSYREPDVLFVARENLSRLTEDRLEGPADLIVEIISADSVHRDRHTKFSEYAEAGIREYWIVDPRPRRQAADFFRLNDQSEYELFATEADEKAMSQVLPGFWLKPAWLWQADTLSPLTALLEVRGLSSEQIQQVQNLLTQKPAGNQ